MENCSNLFHRGTDAPPDRCVSFEAVAEDGESVQVQRNAVW